MREEEAPPEFTEIVMSFLIISIILFGVFSGLFGKG